jgi:tetratricopeptide (TPR) repeat protein
MLGKLNLFAGKNEEALKLIQKAQELAPKAPYTYTLLAGVYSALGQTDQAVDEYEELIKVNPRLETAHMALAVLFESKGDEKKVREHYTKALELNPEFAPAANNLAWMITEEEGGDLGEAMRLALVAKEQFPEDPYIADTLGWVHYKRQSYGLALTQFVQAANDLPDNMTVQYHLALAFKAKGEIDKARETLTAVLASGSEFPEKDAATKLLQGLQ